MCCPAIHAEKVESLHFLGLQGAEGNSAAGGAGTARRLVLLRQRSGRTHGAAGAEGNRYRSVLQMQKSEAGYAERGPGGTRNRRVPVELELMLRRLRAERPGPRATPVNAAEDQEQRL